MTGSIPRFRIFSASSRAPNENGDSELARIVAQDRQVKEGTGNVSGATRDENVGLGGRVHHLASHGFKCSLFESSRSMAASNGCSRIYEQLG